ncbi:MAG: MmcQ/YjbR family DNA-binding protein, partial [Bacteroidia bacterium]
LRNYCISKKGAEECFPFGEETLVFKVMGKAFLLCGINDQPLSFNVKCDPEKAIELRENYSFVEPGYHMNKKHWNTVTCGPGVPKKLLKEWIDYSYDLVGRSLTKAQKSQLAML